MSRTRRVLGVLVASGLISTGLLGGTAFAADEDLSVSPSYGPNNSSSAQTLTFTTSGASFVPGASVLLTYHDVPSRTITNSSPSQVDFSNQKKLTAPVTLTAKAPGAYDVKVTNPGPGGTVYSCASCFTVTGGIPTTNGFGRTANSGSKPASFTLTGSNFAVGTTLSFLQAGVEDPKVVWTTTGTTGSSVTGTLAIDPAAKGGTYDVLATNTDGKKATCTGCLQVPRVSAVRRADQPAGTAAAALGYGVTHEALVVTGVGLTPSTSFGFYSQALNPNATKVNSKTYDAVTKSVTLDVSVSDPSSSTIANAVDTYGVIALDKGDGYGTLADALTLSPRPALDSNAPFDKDNPGQATTGFVVGLKGTGFQPGMTASFNPSTGITVNHVDVHSPTLAGLDLTIAGDAPLTARSLHLTNPDHGVNAATTSMTPSAAPVITSSSPSFVGIGASSVTITLTGSGFQTQSLGENGTASTSNSYNEPVLFVFGHKDWTMSGSAVASNSGKNLTATLNIPAGTESGAYRIGYLDKNGSIVECFTPSHGACFTVEDLAVSSVSPSVVTNDSTAQTLVITGAGFVDGAVPVLQRQGQPDVVGTNVRELTPTSLKADFDVDGIAPGNGAWDVRVTLPGGKTGHKANALSVASAVPHMTSISPTAIGAGNPALVVTVKGSNLARGAKLSFSGFLGTPVTGPTQVSSEWINSGEMRFTLNTVGAAAGQRGVVLTNTDDAATPSTDCAYGSCLVVNAAPTATSANPAGRAAGSPTTSVTINGSFSGTPSVQFSGTGVTAGSPTTVSASSFSVPVTVAPDADPGARDVTVTNPDGGMATCSGCFTVKAPPTITSVTPVAQRVGTGPTDVTISGTGFDTGGVAVSFGPDVTTGTATVTATSITVPVTVGPAAAPGARDVTVTNTQPANGGVATEQKAFSVGDLPSVPLNLTATRGNGVVNLGWAAPASSGGLDLTGYDVTVTKTADGLTPAPTPDVTVEGTTAQVSGLVNGTSYSFTVAAKNAVGTGPATSPVAAVPASVPDAPTDVAVTPGQRSASLTWTAPTNDGGSPVTSYQVFLADGTLKGTVTTTAATIGGLTRSATYSFYVVAVNAVGGSAPSDTSTPVTPLKSTAAISLGTLPTRVVQGAAITLTGTLTRPDKGVAAGPVVLKVRSDSGAVSTVASVATDVTGRYSYRFVPLFNGTYTATYAGDNDNTAASSVARRTLVAVRITASAPTGSHTVNQAISGSVSPSKAGYTVTLYAVAPNGALTRLASTRVSIHRTYGFSVRLSKGSHLMEVRMANTPGNDHGVVRFTAKRT